MYCIICAQQIYQKAFLNLLHQFLYFLNIFINRFCSVGKAFLNCVNFCFLSIFFLMYFAWWKKVGLLHITYIVIRIHDSSFWLWLSIKITKFQNFLFRINFLRIQNLLSDCNRTQIQNHLACKRTLNQISTHRTDKYSQHSSIIWPIWLNDWVFVYKLSAVPCLFQARSSLTFRQL